MQVSEQELVESSADSGIISLDAAPILESSPGNISYEFDFPYGEIQWDYDIKYLDYVVYLDGAVNKTGYADKRVTTFNITGFHVGVYNITMNTSNVDGWVVDTIWLDVLEPFAPVFNEDPGFTFIFEQSAIIYSLEWNFSDFGLDSYILYQDSIVNASGTNLNTNNSVVTLDLLGLNDYQEYNFTIVVVDEIGLSSNRTTLVTPVPAAAPNIIDKPSLNNLIDQTDYFWLNWTVSDLNPDSYIIYQDNATVASGDWQNNTEISYLVHGLDKGDYNYTITLNDTNGYTTTDTVWLSTYDEVDPNFISVPDNKEIIFGTISNVLTWEVNDTYPDSYVIYKNGIEIDSGDWIIEGEIVLSIGSSSLGIFNYTIVVNDTSGNSFYNTVFVTVIPIATYDPIINYGSSVYFSESDTLTGTWTDIDDTKLDGASIELVLTDDNLEVVDTELFLSATDTNGYYEITLTYSDILPGNYTWTLTINKLGFAQASVSFDVTVMTMVTVDPSIAHNVVVTVREVDTISGIWKDINNASIANVDVQITLFDNNSQIVPNNDYQSITNGDGYFEFSLDYSNILPGNYTWNIILNKTGYVSCNIPLEVSVLPLNVDLSVTMGSIMTQHEEYQIYANVTTSGAQSALMLNEFGAPVSGVQVSLEVLVLLTNSSQSQILLTASTNASGIATFILSADQTLVIQEILGISVSVDDPYVSETSTEVNNSELPEVQENVIVPTTSITPTTPTTPTTPPGGENPDRTSQLLIIALIAVSALAILLLIMRALSGKRVSGELERQLLEFYFIRNIQLLLIKNLNGLPVFEKKFSQLETDPTLLAGLSHALSMFIDEVSKGGGQVEYLERGDFSLISVRGTNTVLTLVSGSGFPKRINKQLIDAFTQIEAEVFPNVSEQITMISSSDDKAVFDIFDYHGIPIGLLDKLTINMEQLTKSTNGFSSSPAFEIISSFSERETFQLNHLIDSIEGIGTSQEEMAKIILAAYAAKIIIPYEPQY
jgi:hypothetical protein